MLASPGGLGPRFSEASRAVTLRRMHRLASPSDRRFTRMSLMLRCQTVIMIYHGFTMDAALRVCIQPSTSYSLSFSEHHLFRARPDVASRLLNSLQR